MHTTMIAAATLLGLSAIGVSQSDDAWHPASVIFVDSLAGLDGDGSASAPHQTIARAVQHARKIRAERQGRIIVRVAPGEYVEELPIYLNLSDFELRGSTRLTKDGDGLPQNCGFDLSASPCIEPGTETVITPVTPLATGQVMLAIAPTRDAITDRLTDVTVRGLVFDGRALNVAASGTGVLVDRTEGFRVRENVTRHVLVGVLTRLASGTISEHFAYDSNDGLAVGAGSTIYPAIVHVTRTRLVNLLSQGAIALGVAGARGRSSAPDLLPVQTVYDRVQHPEEVPDRLAITLRNNDISRNRIGFRFESFSANNSFYDTIDAQPMTANITALVQGNSFNDNEEYGLTVEGAFATRSNPRLFTGRFEGRFEDNDLSGNGRAGLFLGFMLNGVVTRNPGLITTNKYLVDSRFTVEMDGGFGDFDYDNPVLDPFDRTTPLNNVLVVNGISVVGTYVTCPPGLPCVQ